MRPKFNKTFQKWGIWIDGIDLWMVNLDTELPLLFQQKQEAQKEIKKLHEHQS
jgi:hypothetical protein